MIALPKVWPTLLPNILPEKIPELLPKLLFCIMIIIINDSKAIIMIINVIILVFVFKVGDQILEDSKCYGILGSYIAIYIYSYTAI